MRQIKSSLLYKWFQEVWNENKEDSISKLMTDDAVLHGISLDNQLKGASAFQSFYKTFRDQFHEINFKVEDVLAQDDMESALTTVTAIDTKKNINVQFSGQCQIRIKDGKIAEAWNHYDFLSMYQQLGLALS